MSYSNVWNGGQQLGCHYLQVEIKRIRQVVMTTQFLCILLVRFCTLNFTFTYKRPLVGQPVLRDGDRSPVTSRNHPHRVDTGQIRQLQGPVQEPSSTPTLGTSVDYEDDDEDEDVTKMATQSSTLSPDSNTREDDRSRRRTRAMQLVKISPTPTHIRALQESLHQALVGGVVPPDSLSDSSNNSAGGRGRSERKGWRNRLTAAEHYATSLIFGRGGSGIVGSGSVSGSSALRQILRERED